MSSIASVLLLALCLVCTAQAWRYQPVGPSLSPAPVSASQIAKVTNVATDIRRRWEQLDASCDARAVFALAYVHMTESITRFIQNNYFDDGNSMADFVVELANKYTTTFDAWAAADVAQVSGAWAEAYSWTIYGDSNATEDLLLGLNAHMGYDLAVTTFNMKYYEPSKKADYDRVNDQINAVLYNASTDLSQRYDPLLAPSRIEGGITNYLLPKIISWRADAMKSAILFSLAQTTSQLEVFAKGCDNAASLKAYTFQQAKASTAEARFDYCKENQPQAKARSLAAALAAAAAAAAAPVRSAAPAPKDSNAEEVVVAPPDASAKGLPNVRVEGGFTSLLAGLKL